MKNLLRLIMAGSVLIIFSCKKDSGQYKKNVFSPLTIEFDNIAGEQDLALDTAAYVNAAGESFSVSKLQYFISNIILENADGTVYTVPQDSSYFLINEASPESQLVHLNIPEGEYRKLSFMVGVDSARTLMDLNKRTGVLAPATDTYWSSENGYIFFNMEGISAAAPEINGVRKFTYHIGGYSSATVNNIKMVQLDLSARGAPKVLSGHDPEVHLMADVLKVFTGKENISLASHNNIEVNDTGADVAGNYQNMFRHDHTHNN